MKISKLLVYFCAAATLLLYGCGSEGNSDSSLTDSSQAAVLKAPQSINKDPEADQYPGVYISGGLKTGLKIHAPAGIGIYKNLFYEEGNSLAPDKIPTSAEPFIISDENGNSMNFFASAGQNYYDFKILDENDVKQVFLSDIDKFVDGSEVLSYETGTYGEYSGIKMEVKSLLNGLELNQTIIVINAVDQNSNKGYLYTITYTDMTGDMKEAINESIASIKFSNVQNIAENYSTPELCAEAQEDGTFNAKSSGIIISTAKTPAYTKPSFNQNPAVTRKRESLRIDRDKYFKDILIEDGMDEESADEYLNRSKKPRERNTRTTLSQEEMRKKYLGE